jgi:hypothetical protein
VLLRADLLAGLAGAAATVPLLALGLVGLRGRARSAFATGADVMIAAVLGAAVVAAARGGAAPWRGIAAVEATANAVLAIACLCAVVPPLTARFGSSRWSSVLAALAGGAVVLRGGLALAVSTGLAVRDDPARISGVALGVILVCLVTAAVVLGLRLAGVRARHLATPWLVVLCGVVAVSTAVALACAEGVLFPIQLRVSAGSSFATPGSMSEAILEGLTGIAHVVPRAQVAAIAAALVVGALLAVWQTRRLRPEPPSPAVDAS